MMATMTYAPVFRRTVGFDRFNDVFDLLFRDSEERNDNYPPYNIEKKGEDQYRIIMAVAGFSMDDLTIVLENGLLRVRGELQRREPDEDTVILHQGIAGRSFERVFRLADHIEVHAAELTDGLLRISLLRVIPEEQKPKRIPINGQALTVGVTPGQGSNTQPVPSPGVQSLTVPNNVVSH